jgi:hypothetical protein
VIHDQIDMRDRYGCRSGRDWVQWGRWSVCGRQHKLAAVLCCSYVGSEKGKEGERKKVEPTLAP